MNSSSLPPPAIRQPGLAEFGLLAFLGFVWGSSFLFIKIAVDHGLPPLTLATLRIGLGAMVLIALARWRGQAWPRGIGLWLRLGLLGIIGNSLPFFLIGWGEQFTTSQLAAVLMATVPLFVAVVAHLMTHDEKMSAAKIAGLVFGFAGVVVLVGVDALNGLGAQVIGQAAILCACISYSFNGVLQRRLPQIGAEMTVGIILMLGFLVMTPVWLIVDQPWQLAPDGKAIFAVIWLGILSTAFGNWLFFTIMRRVGASFASTNNFVVPIMGLGWGFFGYNEEPGVNALIALVLILIGLALPRIRWKKA